MSAMVKEVYDAFRSAGVSDEQAAAAALAIPPREELATKTDLAEFRTEVKTDIAELRAEFRELRADTHSDMKDLELRLTLRFFTAVALAVAGIKALDFLIG